MINWHAVKSDRGLARAQQWFDRDRRVAEIALRQRIHAMIVQASVLRV